MTHPTELLTKDVLDHGSWRMTTPLRTLLDLARRDAIRSRSDEAGDRAALRIERAPWRQFETSSGESPDPQPQKIGSPLVSM